jgi:hypothetical protein
MPFASTPTIFAYKGHEILAAATKDGHVFLLDTASLGGADHKAPLFISAATATMQGYSPSALATWEDSAQNRWLLAPVGAAKGSVAAFKVTGDAERPALQPGWVSRDLVSPAATIVVNGVAFVLSTGEYIPATATASLADKISKPVPAVLCPGCLRKGTVEQRQGYYVVCPLAGVWSSTGRLVAITAQYTRSALPWTNLEPISSGPWKQSALNTMRLGS